MMGHNVDDGLELRKAAFECMNTLLDTCVDRLYIFELLTLTYLMVARYRSITSLIHQIFH